MSRKFRICLDSYLAFLAMLVLGVIAGTALVGKWTPLAFGFLSFLVSGFLLLIGHANGDQHVLYGISSLLSGFGSGLSIAAYFLHIAIFDLIDFQTLVALLMMVCCGAAAFLLLYAASLNIRFIGKHLAWFTYPLLIAGIATLVILWGTADKIVFSLAFFVFLTTAFFAIALIVVAKNEREFGRNIAFASLGAVFLITLIVLLILSSFDFLEGLFDGASTDGPRLETPRRSRLDQRQPKNA